MSYKLKDGDIVEFVEPVKISGYVYCPDFVPNGVWVAGHVLPKVRGCGGPCSHAEGPSRQGHAGLLRQRGRAHA